jgi:magnesium-transporting ATPase (P-type)
VISSDKTGTLTTNQMTVQQVLAGGKRFEVTGLGYDPEGEFQVDGEPLDPSEDEDLYLALQIAALTNDSRLSMRKPRLVCDGESAATRQKQP